MKGSSFVESSPKPGCTSYCGQTVPGTGQRIIDYSFWVWPVPGTVAARPQFELDSELSKEHLLSESLNTVLLFLPLIVIVWLANQAERRRSDASATIWRRLTYAVVAGFYGIVLLLGLLLMLGTTIGTIPLLEDFVASISLRAESGLPVDRIVQSLPSIGLGISIAAAMGILFLWKPVRRVLARLLPIDADSPVHAVALSFTMLIVLNMVVILAIGLDTLTEVVVQQAAEGALDDVSPAMLGGLWVQQGLMALWALIGVGWLSRRPLGETLARLGIVRPSLRDVAVGIGAGFSAVLVSMILSGVATGLGVGVDPDVQGLNEVLLGPLLGSAAGILTIGFAAALGEETLFRGALQPRFGILLTTILFAITHNQYGLSLSTVVVFAAGLIFAWLRHRYNTVAAMLAHATYNITLGLLALLALRLLENTQI